MPLDSVWGLDLFLVTMDNVSYQYSPDILQNSICTPSTYKLFSNSSEEVTIATIEVRKSSTYNASFTFKLNSFLYALGYSIRLRFEFDYNTDLAIEYTVQNMFKEAIILANSSTDPTVLNIYNMIKNHYEAGTHTPLIIYSYFTKIE